MSRVQIADESGSLYVGINDEMTNKLLGLSADEAHNQWLRVEDANDEDRKKYIKETYENI